MNITYTSLQLAILVHETPMRLKFTLTVVVNFLYKKSPYLTPTLEVCAPKMENAPIIAGLQR